MIKRLFVLGIDGVPCSLVERMSAAGYLDNLRELCERGSYGPMTSALPPVSSVAWTTYSTGENPGSHGVYGFLDRKPNPFSLFIPLSSDIRARSLWKLFSEREKRVIVVNVPLTYPPEEVNGIVASGFLCPDMDKLCFPAEWNEFFRSRGYVIDVDAWKWREDPGGFYNDLVHAMERRFEIAFELMETQSWDFFQLHVMETDRFLHFFWDEVEREDFGGGARFFRLLDDFIGRLRERLAPGDGLVVLSDHGFCGTKKKVELNLWLEQEGLLRFDSREKREIRFFREDTVCYSFIPGRIYINLEGREERGSVRGSDYEKTRRSIRDRLLDFRDPGTGEVVLENVFFNEDIYEGPAAGQGPDMVVLPRRGYDLKGGLTGEVIDDAVIGGMHTYDDAFICSDSFDASMVGSIQDVRGALLGLF